MEKLVRAKIGLKELWGWDEYYFYPLAPARRTDLLALDSIKLENKIPEVDFKKFLGTFFAGNTVYAFPESDPPYLEKSLEDYGYWYSELCIADSSLKNLVYWSHEDTITLGGLALIEKFKLRYPEYSLFAPEWGYKL